MSESHFLFARVLFLALKPDPTCGRRYTIHIYVRRSKPTHTHTHTRKWTILQNTHAHAATQETYSSLLNCKNHWLPDMFNISVYSLPQTHTEWAVANDHNALLNTSGDMLRLGNRPTEKCNKTLWHLRSRRVNEDIFCYLLSDNALIIGLGCSSQKLFDWM